MDTPMQSPETFPGMNASLCWAGDLAFEAEGMSGATLRIDQPSDEGGGGRGFKPVELQLHALAACMGTTVVKILVKQRAALYGYRIDAHGERDPAMPHAYTRIILDHVFRGPGLRQIGKHTSELQSRVDLVCRLLLEKKK